MDITMDIACILQSGYLSERLFPDVALSNRDPETSRALTETFCCILELKKHQYNQYSDVKTRLDKTLDAVLEYSLFNDVVIPYLKLFVF